MKKVFGAHNVQWRQPMHVDSSTNIALWPPHKGFLAFQTASSSFQVIIVSLAELVHPQGCEQYTMIEMHSNTRS